MSTQATSAVREVKPEAVAEALRNAADQERPAVFVIGAGCSFSAGVPLARDVIDYVRVRYPKAYASARRKVQEEGGHREPTYPEVMARVSWQSRYLLFNRFVNLSWLNWTHVSLAYLMQQGLIGRILTTNFDDLILRACALYGCYPAVHDLGLAAKLLTHFEDGKEASSFEQALSLEPAVFYLHGRHNGFFQAHSSDEVGRQARHLEAVIDRDVQDHRPRPWVIVGYSGDSDPLFQTLKRLFPFPAGLYWVNLREPPPAVTKILAKSANAAFVRIEDADEFFLGLADKLGVGRHALQTAPFLHPLGVFHALKAPRRRRPPLPEPRRVAKAVRAASRRAESRLDRDAALVTRAETLFSKAAWNALIQFASRLKHRPLPVARMLADAYMRKGDALMKRLPAPADARYRPQLQRACQCYDRIQTLVADTDEVLHHWVQSLKKLGRSQVTPETVERWRAQVEAYDAAKQLRVLRTMALVKSGEALVLASKNMPDGKKAASALVKASRRLRSTMRDGHAGNIALTLADVICARVRREHAPRPGLLATAKKEYGIAISGLGEHGRIKAQQRARARTLLRCVTPGQTQEQLLARLAAVRGCLGGPLKVWGKP